MTTVYSPSGSPVEVAAGRGDLRFSSFPNQIAMSPGAVDVSGGKTVSYAQLYASQPWVAAAIGRLMFWAARVPLKCYRREGEEARTRLLPGDHPIADVIHRPWLGRELGPATQTRLIQCLLGPLLVHGNALANIINDKSGFFLEPLDWRFLVPIGLQDGVRLFGFRYQLPNKHVDLPINDLVHLAWWSSLGPLGISPLEQLGTTINIEDAAQRYQKNLFSNGARPPSAITTDTEFLTLERSERQLLLEQMRADVNALHAGVDNAGRPPILPPGLDWKMVGQSAVEAALVDQRKLTREEVAAVYQMLPPMLGILDNATVGAAFQTYREMAYTDSLGPPLVLLEQTLTAILARDTLNEDDVFLEFDFGPVLRGDRLKEITALRAGIGSAIYTPNEGRRALNMPPSENPAADELYIPANNLQPLGTPPSNGPPDPTAQDAPDPSSQSVDPGALTGDDET